MSYNKILILFSFVMLTISCSTRHTTRKKISETIYDKMTTIPNKHDQVIGVLLEKHKKNKLKTNAIIQGIKYSLKKINPNYKARFIIKKVLAKKTSIDNALNHLIHRHKAGLIISWGRQIFLEYLQSKEKKLNFPIIYIHKNLEKTKNAFYVFPNSHNFSATVIQEMKRKGIKRIAMLTPKKYIDSDFIKTLKKYLRENDIELVFDEKYHSEVGETMDLACKKIFIIDRKKRENEYQKIFAEENMKAKKSGYKLNQKLVFLPAKITFDAIFIPDNFKAVRYFIKLFKFHKAENLPLIGTYEWRSPELVNPPEPYLNGASFIDYIGDYNALPILEKDYSYKSVTGESLKIEYKLMGYYAALLGQIAVKKSNKNINNIKTILNSIRIKDNFIKNKKAFLKNSFNWPAFSFEIKDFKYQIKSLNIPTKVLTTKY